jgi:hypothetical protein
MSLHTKTTWAQIVGVALVTLIGVGVLMRAQHDHRVAQPSAPLSAPHILDTAPAHGDRPPPGRAIEDTPASKPELDRALAAMHKEIAALRSQVLQLEHAQASQAIDYTSSVATPGREAATAADLLAQQEAARQAEARIQVQEALIEETLVTETADASWAPAAESALADVLQREELQALQLVSMECRSTLCRIAITPNASATDGGSFDENIRKLLLFAPWSGQGFGRVDPDGPSPTAVFFLAREGHPLPQPTP